MRRITLAVGFLLTVVLAPTVATAHVPPSSTELDWHVGFMDYGDVLDDDLLLGIYVARNISGGWGLEGGFGLTPGDEFKGYFAHANGVYNIKVPTWERFDPFLTAGVGLFAFSPEVGDSETNLAINFGGGAKLFMTPRLAIRGDIRDHMVFADDPVTGDNDTTNNLQFSAGLTYFILSE